VTARSARASLVRAVAIVVALSATAAPPASAGERAAFSGSFSVALRAPAAQALPLFDPLGEARWAPRWEPVFARASDRTTLPEGAVFTTRGDDGRPMTWLLQRYDRRSGEIAYAVFVPDDAVISIRIVVHDRTPGTSEAQVSYDVVAISTAGDRFVQDFRTSFPHMQPHWQRALDAATDRRP
jgi:hypothetical protein